MFPRAPKRSREVRCYSDCLAQSTGNPSDCQCADRDEAAYLDECEARYDRYKNGDYDND